MSEAICTCHCGGAMFYRHLHAESCILSREGEEAPKSELQTLRDERDRLRRALAQARDSAKALHETVMRNVKPVPDMIVVENKALDHLEYLDRLLQAAALTPAGQRLTPNEAME